MRPERTSYGGCDGAGCGISVDDGSVATAAAAEEYRREGSLLVVIDDDDEVVHREQRGECAMN